MQLSSFSNWNYVLLQLGVRALALILRKAACCLCGFFFFSEISCFMYLFLYNSYTTTVLGRDLRLALCWNPDLYYIQNRLLGALSS